MTNIQQASFKTKSVHPAPTDHLGLNIDERDQIFLKCTLET